MLKKGTENNSTIEYAPEELEEINRIVGLLPGSDQASTDEDEYYSFDSKDTPDETLPESLDDFGDSGDIDMPESLDDFDSSSAESDDGIQDISSLITEVDEIPDAPINDSLGDLESFTDDQSQELSDISIEKDTAVDMDSGLESLDGLGEIDESDDFGMGDIQLDDTASDESIDLPDIPDMSDIAVDETETPSLEETDEVTTMGQLNSLTKDEPESVDDQDISEDAQIDNRITEFFGESEEVDEPDKSSGISIDSESIEDIPDLSEISADSIESVDEADSGDIPDIDLGGFDDDAIVETDSRMDDLGDFENVEMDLDSEPDIMLDENESTEHQLDEVSAPVNIETDDDLFNDLPDIPDMDQIDEVVETTDIPDIEEPEPVSQTPNESLDLSSDELRKVKKALLLFPPGLTDAIKDTILNDRLSPTDTRRLVDMLLDGRPENNIHRYLEKKLNKKISAAQSSQDGSRRALYARPEYTSEGRERQKVLFKRTAIIGATALVIIGLTVGIWNFIYIPQRAKGLIDKGVVLIKKKNDPKTEDYRNAETNFDEAMKLKPDYLYGYSEYGKAYLYTKDYERALNKLNNGYDIAKKHKFKDMKILNSLGYFYSKVSDRFYNRISDNVENYYFDEKYPALEKIESKYDLAIHFYRLVLNKDAFNEDALFGIGNAYYNQGLYLKARNYYEDILKKDKKSVVGHSGLLNLFIEQNDFPEVVMIYVSLRDKNLLEKVPPPLLGKMANYFLGKSRSDLQNIRIDYGIQSSRLIDSDDQPFPAVLTTLRALKNADEDYPPLYLYYAKLAYKMKNRKLALQHLNRALDKAEKRGESYFGARQMLGEFYYNTNNPVKAYENLKKAVTAYENPAEFTTEDFYVETENIGKSYAIMGNIFYYFFDKIRFDFGDQESLNSAELEKDMEKMSNFLIAQEKYEKAFELGYKSPELYYNLGRIYYLNKNYEKSLNNWLNLYDDFTAAPELMFALGNAFYKLNSIDSSKAQFLKLIDLYEYEAEKIKRVKPANPEHFKIFQTLSSAYNNIGVLYQIEGDEAKSSISYWKSIEYARALEKENEFARVNVARALKNRQFPIVPILDDNIPYSIPFYRETMRN